MKYENHTDGIFTLVCEHCDGGRVRGSRPVPDVVLKALVCRDCRKDGTGRVYPVQDLKLQ